MCKVFDGCMLRCLCEYQGGAPNTASGIGGEMGGSIKGRFPRGKFPKQRFEQLIRAIPMIWLFLGSRMAWIEVTELENAQCDC